MGYKILGSGPQIPERAAIFAGTARDALQKLESMKDRFRHDGMVRIFANGIGISEEELHRIAEKE